MKNFICFVILLIFAGFVFFIGWTQIKVGPESIGIVQSKTSGIDSKIVIPGKFSWHKEFLIPSNAVINKFEYKPYNSKKTISGKKTGFSSQNNSYDDILDYSFTFQISLSYTPEVVMELLEENTISSQKDFDEYLDGVCAYLSQRAADYYLSKYIESEDFRPEAVRFEEVLSSIAFYKNYPQFDINVFALNEYKLPYYTMYNSIKDEV